jgi:hypothetical protein
VDVQADAEPPRFAGDLAQEFGRAGVDGMGA